MIVNVMPLMRALKHTAHLSPGQWSLSDEGGAHPVPQWFAVTPNGILTYIGGHEIEVHDDGAITVRDSEGELGLIQATQGRKSWAGYLDHGQWRTATKAEVKAFRDAEAARIAENPLVVPERLAKVTTLRAGARHQAPPQDSQRGTYGKSPEQPNVT